MTHNEAALSSLPNNKESPSLPSSPSFSVATLSTEGGSPGPEFIVDDIELLSILAATTDEKNHAIYADSNSDIQIPIMTSEDWAQQDKKRKRDDDEDDFNFLDQFDFVDVSFDETSKKQKTFVDDNIEDLTSLLKQSDKLMADLDYRWVLDITS